MKYDCDVAETCKKVKKAISSGCRMLAIREHSEQQIRIKLIKKGFERETINQCVDYLYNQNWLSETRFCNGFIRSRAEKGQGLIRIESELQAQNIQRTTIDQQLELEDIDWQQACERALLKKVRPLLDCFDETVLDINNGYDGLVRTKSIVMTGKNKIKLENFLRYRGFSLEEIKIATNKYLSIEHQEFG